MPKGLQILLNYYSVCFMKAGVILIARVDSNDTFLASNKLTMHVNSHAHYKFNLSPIPVWLRSGSGKLNVHLFFTMFCDI